MVYARKAKLDVSLFLLNEYAAATSSQTGTYFFSSFFWFFYFFIFGIGCFETLLTISLCVLFAALESMIFL